MPLDPQKILNWKFPEVEHTYSERDTILYALGLGCGSDPGEEGDLKYVYERGLVAVPTMAVVLAYPGNWLESKELTADYSKVLHGEQYLTMHRPIPAAGKRDRPRARQGSVGQGQREGRRSLCRTTDPRQGRRAANRDHDVGGDAARRWRVRRQTRAAATATRAA